MQHIELDGMGRADSVSYIPYIATNNTGLFVVGSRQKQSNYYSSLHADDVDKDYAFA